MPKPDVVVVGAGAAGIMAAWRAATLGAQVLLLEKTPRVGTKILISGGGKCNITHHGSVDEVLRGFRTDEARFLRPSFYRWTNDQVVALLTRRGVEVYVRPNGRVFPVEKTAKDVVAVLRSYLDEAGVELRLDSPVGSLELSESRVAAVVVGSERIECQRVVVCTGGSSYPNSGTTGDGWHWARAAGHTIVPVRAALAPVYLELEEARAETLSGVALRDVVLKARADGREIDRWRGDLLFTHHGVSGPCALEVSRALAEQPRTAALFLEVDVLPDQTPEETMEWARNALAEFPKRRVKTLVEGLVPESAAPWLLRAAEVDPETVAGQLDRKSRNRLVATLKGWNLGAVRAIPLEKGEVVAGGVALDEVDPHTMGSRKCEGLFLCGEVLAVAGRVGGYNLQAAWSTGYVAGESAVR
ncbi:MAG: aminoacetone oxidase family FAD-binding enzyme [Fimbriimonadaceae bacterium]|nr:aminoacetone oxidase family FAD-binding enzyme [Fimbriimonadaceae bacterium]